MYSAAIVQPCRVQYSRSCKSWLSVSWPLSLVDTRQYRAARGMLLARLSSWLIGLLSLPLLLGFHRSPVSVITVRGADQGDVPPALLRQTSGWVLQFPTAAVQERSEADQALDEHVHRRAPAA